MSVVFIGDFAPGSGSGSGAFDDNPSDSFRDGDGGSGTASVREGAPQFSYTCRPGVKQF